MKKLLYLICLIALQSCSPSLQGFGWVAPVGLFVGALIYSVIAIKNSFKFKVSVTKIKESLFAVIFFLAAIGVFIWMQSAK